MASRPTVTGTAFGPVFIVAVEQFTPLPRRVLRDPLAHRLLPPGTQTFIPLCQWVRMRKQLVANQY